MKKLRFHFHFLFFSIIYTIIVSVQAQTLYWQKLTSDIYVYDILYDGEQNIYFSGNQSYRYFWRSSDFGATWTRLGDGSLSLYRIAIDSTGTLWGGNNVDGGIYKSTNQGDTWTLSLSSSDKIFSITVSPNNWVWAGTYEGKVVQSSNAGSTWVTTSIDNELIWTIASNSLNHIFAGSWSGKIYRTTNLGNDWEIVYNGTTIGNWGIVVDDSDHIYVNRGYIRLVSTDNGNSWTSISGIQLERLFLDKYHNFFSGPLGYRSIDNCVTWTEIGPSGPLYVNAYAFIDSLIFTATTKGVYLHDPSYQPYIGDNYFPLAVGNKWQFNTRCNNDFAGNKIYYVERDSIISGKKYFLLQGDVNDWVRYDQLENRLFLRWNDSDYVVMDYTLNEGSAFPQILFNTHQIKNSTIVSPIFISIFDSIYFSKGNYWTDGVPSFYESQTTYYSEKLGVTKKLYSYTGPGGSGENCVKKIIRAILFDSSYVNLFSDHTKPEILFQPVLVANDFGLNWNFIVDHYYSQFDNNWNENFVDTVLVLSYYSNGDSTIANTPTLAVNQPNSINYTFSYLLDSTLMKNDYKFYYKIYAVDKGIVPEHTTMPDTGYYELVYDPNPVSIEITENSINNYTLGQNYPNPFNPITRINYSVKEDGLVEIIIYDVLGNKLEAIVKERKTIGRYSAEFNATNLSSGIYFYRLQVNDFVEIKKMILLK